MFDKINSDLVNAMKTGDKFTLSVLRMLKSALQLEKINNKKEMTDEVVMAVIKKQVKQRNDSCEEYLKLGKTEVADDLKKEIAILSAYLPEEASIEEITRVVDEAFNTLNPTSMKDMGSLMKFVTSKLSNVDNAKVSNLIKERLVK